MKYTRESYDRFNSDHGQIFADKVLGKIGDVLNNDKRATDETFRQFLRGDELVIVADDTKLDDSVRAAERKRKLIGGTTFDIDGTRCRLTVSCGVNTLKAGVDDLASVIERTFQALTEAKAIRGKNSTRRYI